jgi:16S rRNA (adenine1518-N6/adenine1519-N6)-dimethyltransferase
VVSDRGSGARGDAEREPGRRPDAEAEPQVEPDTEPRSTTQPSLRRMRDFAIRPKRDLGQNFLIDSNILGVIEREARLEPQDVVLEIGGGLGVLSEFLAARVAHVHDAMRLDLRALDPAPTKVVANLPYGIAAGAILRTIEDLPGVRRWVGMVQKEVGERFAAAPATSAYGLPSVLAQLACDVQVLRPVSRSVFSPAPNVDSVLVGLQRTGPAPEPDLRELVAAAFAHRRKALPGSLALAANAPPDVRARARRALAELGHPPDARAERLSPQDFRALRDSLRE